MKAAREFILAPRQEFRGKSFTYPPLTRFFPYDVPFLKFLLLCRQTENVRLATRWVLLARHREISLGNCNVNNSSQYAAFAAPASWNISLSGCILIRATLKASLKILACALNFAQVARRDTKTTNVCVFEPRSHFHCAIYISYGNIYIAYCELAGCL